MTIDKTPEEEMLDEAKNALDYAAQSGMQQERSAWALISIAQSLLVIARKLEARNP